MEWKEFRKVVLAWKKANKGWDEKGHANYQEDLLSLENVLDKGSKNPARRTKIMKTIRMFFEDIESTPFRYGKASTIKPEVMIEYDREKVEVRTLLIQMWENSEYLQKYAVKSKRGGGGVFGSGEEYADYMLTSIDTRVFAAMRGTSKDYAFQSGRPLRNLIPQKEA